MDDPDRLQAGVRHTFKQALTGAEDYRDNIKDELVDRVRRERLPDNGGPAGDVDVTGAGRGPGLLQGGGDPAGDEVKRRPALHLDRVVRVVGEDKDGSVVRRLLAPPAAPIAVPLIPDRTEH